MFILRSRVNGGGVVVMEGASMPTNPRTVEEVFKDYKGRRAGMLKALTTGKVVLQTLFIA